MRLASSQISRRYARIVRQAPAFPLSLAVAFGQCLIWFAPQGLWAYVVAVLGCAIILVGSKQSVGLLVGVLLGSSVVCVNFPISSPLLNEKDIVLQGRIVSSVQRRRPGEATFLFKTVIEGHPYTLRCRAVDLPWRHTYGVRKGDRLFVRGETKAVKKPVNPLSWQGWLWRQGVAGEMKVRFVSKPLSREYSLHFESRKWVQRWVYEKFGDVRGVNLVLSMALGYQDVLSPTLERAFKRLGLTHLLVVSGYQVTLLYSVAVSCLSKIFLFLPSRLSVRRVVGVVGLIISLFYVIFIGSEFSSVRAMLAAACVGGGWIVGRQTGFMQRWGVALLLLEILWPFCIFDLGVILTFAALWGIGIGAEGNKTDSWRAFFRVNFCVWLTTSLVIMLWQGSVSTLGLLINILVAAPWSIMNCTLGIGALFVAVLPGWAGTLLLRVVIAVNVFLSEQVLYWGNKQYSQATLTGYGQVGVSFFLLLCVVYMSIQAYRMNSLKNL